MTLAFLVKTSLTSTFRLPSHPRSRPLFLLLSFSAIVLQNYHKFVSLLIFESFTASYVGCTNKRKPRRRAFVVRIKLSNIPNSPGSHLPPKRQHPGTYESPTFHFHFFVAIQQYDRISQYIKRTHTYTYNFAKLLKFFFL